MECLRSDHGGEFIGKDFQDILCANGITHKPSPVYTPEYNGVAERFNRTVAETARTVLFASGLGLSLWAEAISYVTRIHNLVGTKVNGGLSPHE